MPKISGKKIITILAAFILSWELCFAADSRNISFENYQKQECENYENNYSQPDLRKIQPYSEALLEAFKLMALQNYKIGDSGISTEEFTKNLLIAALKSMATEDKRGAALTPKEWEIFLNQQAESYFGIGAAIEQIEKWTLISSELSPIEENNILEKYDNTLLGIKLIAPNGKIMETMNLEIVPIGSELAIKTKIDNRNLREEKFIRERNYAEIREIFPGGPAEKTGLLKKGAVILEIDGKNTKKFDIYQNISNLKNAAKNQDGVKLLIRQDNIESTVAIRGEKINTNEATTVTKITDNAGYIKILQFNHGISETIKKILEDFSEKNIKNLIIDLRNNPGGLLNEVLDIAGYFTGGPDKILIKTITRSRESLSKSYSPGPLFHDKIIVLINKESASASEILSGILQKHGLAKIFGEKSYGKGSIQRSFKLSDNDAIAVMYFTIAEYQIWDPINKQYVRIDGKGVQPDIKCNPNISIETLLELPAIKQYFK